MKTNGSVLLELNGVTKSYASPGAPPPIQVLQGISLRVGIGESLAIVGPSGSGKSTLLNLIGALDRPSSGTIVLSGVDLASLSDQELAKTRNRQIGLVFQLHHLLPQCTVLENVLVPTLVEPVRDRDQTEKRARDLLGRVGLGERLDHRPGQLSGGECQRVAVVRALINSPALLLADEPTGSLDQDAADNLAQLLVELNKQDGVALITVTHSVSLARRMGRMLRLANGKLEEDSGSR